MPVDLCPPELDPVAVAVVASPLGVLQITATAAGITRIGWTATGLDDRHGAPAADADGWAAGHIRQAAAELADYFAGVRTGFDVPLAASGSRFALAVRAVLIASTPGITLTYTDVAAAVGSPGAVRAVGNTLAANPVPILVACHRVLPLSGHLGGYSGGPSRKAWLVEHERCSWSAR